MKVIDFYKAYKKLVLRLGLEGTYYINLYKARICIVNPVNGNCKEIEPKVIINRNNSLIISPDTCDAFYHPYNIDKNGLYMIRLLDIINNLDYVDYDIVVDDGYNEFYGFDPNTEDKVLTMIFTKK